MGMREQLGRHPGPRRLGAALLSAADAASGAAPRSRSGPAPRRTPADVRAVGTMSRIVRSMRPSSPRSSMSSTNHSGVNVHTCDVDILTVADPGDLADDIGQGVDGPLGTEHLAPPGLVRADVHGLAEVVVDRSDREDAIGQLVACSAMPTVVDGRRASKQKRRSGTTRKACPSSDENVPDVAQPTHHVGHVLHDVTGDHPVERRALTRRFGQRGGRSRPRRPASSRSRERRPGRRAVVGEWASEPVAVRDVDVRDGGRATQRDRFRQGTDLETATLGQVDVVADDPSVHLGR